MAARLAPDSSPTSTQAAPSRTVLLVEDEQSVREITALFLSQLQFQVLEAGSFEEAMAVACSYPGPIELLMTDVHLGGSDGRVLAEKFAQLRPEVRVLFTSGSDEDAMPAREGQQFLCKPYLIADLRRITTSLLDR